VNTSQLGILIKTLRKQEHMTQEELALKLNVSTSAVSKWETGKNLPDADVIKRLATLFEVSIDELYCPEDTLAKINNLSNGNASDCTEANEIPTQKPVHRIIFILLGLALLLSLTIVGIFVYKNAKKEESINIYPISSRIAEDENLGTVYEVAYIHTGSPEDITGDSPFIIQLSDDWAKNTEVTGDITYMKVSFFTQEQDALQWDTPTLSTYIVR